MKCTKSELDKLYKNYKVEVISEDRFSKVSSNRDFLKEINDRTDYIFFNKKRKLTTRIKVFDEEKSIQRQRDYEKEVDVILDPDKVYSPIDMNNRVNELSYQEFLRKNIIYKLNRVPLDRMLSLKKIMICLLIVLTFMILMYPICSVESTKHQDIIVYSMNIIIESIIC